MKKKLLLSITAFLLSLGSVIGLAACTPKLTTTDDAFFSSWQQSIKDNVKVMDMVVPGTHDSGTKGMIMFAETQQQTIYEQLSSGVRYMDIRVHRTSRDKLLIFHSVVQGMEFAEVIADIKRFVTENPSEVLVLDFQHFENNAEPLVAEILQAELNIATSGLPASSDIANITIGEMRAAKQNYIIAWGSSTVPENVAIRPRNTTLKSPYNGDQHKIDAKTLIKQFDTYIDLHDKSTLFVLQAQRTSPSIGSLYDLEKKFVQPANDYIYNLRNDSVTLAKTNIIMRDYINMKKETINLILTLNITKDNIEKDSLAQFKSKVDQAK